MSAILYPVAANAELAMAAALGRAAREREAHGLAGEAVVFTTDVTGPAFADEAAAQAAFAAPLAEGWARLSEQILPGQTVGHAEAACEDGHRWTALAQPAPRTAWRLMVSYWRVATAGRPISAPQARAARRGKQPLDPKTLQVMARQPLRPIAPQQPLDIGLFEVRPPDAPHIVMPDE
ncbi:hypothetical protein [Phenylobacterium sp.]|jgi:hypothetical protein|uniref:hypothetical protein n=1 Tax=Phenylobacterium sp. TaxID=1871053 RepID=UPI002F3F631D